MRKDERKNKEFGNVLMPGVNKRLYDIVAYYTEGNVSQFVDLVKDKGAANIYQQKLNRFFVEKDGKYPEVTTDVLREITTVFPEIDANWLLNGSGEMFKSVPKVDSDKPEDPQLWERAKIIALQRAFVKLASDFYVDRKLSDIVSGIDIDTELILEDLRRAAEK